MSKYVGMIKVIAALGALAIVIYGVWSLMNMRGPGHSPAPARVEPRDEPKVSEQRAEKAARDAKLAELRRAFARDCDIALIPELAKLLREANYLAEATRIETTACVPQRRECREVRTRIVERLGDTYKSVLADPSIVECEGILVGQPRVVPAFLVTFEDKGMLVRGVSTADGLSDYAPFAPAPGTTLVKIGDLDDNNADDMVYATARDLFVEKVVPGGYITIDGPTLPKGCDATITIEGDFRDGKKGERDRLVLAVPEREMPKKCLQPGRHYYRLDGDTLVGD